MRRAIFLFLVLLLLAGIVFAQNDTPRDFEEVGRIGELRPQGMRYNQPLDQFAMVDLQGRLLLVDAATYETQFVLLESGTYNDYAFSHDGKMLALAIDKRVELYNTETGTLLDAIEPEGALVIPGPLRFSYTDEWISFDTVVPAPRAIRRSENDTTLLPWIWDIKGVLNERPSILPGFADGVPFFDYRNGFVLGPRNIIIGAIARRYQIMRLGEEGLEVLSELYTDRAEIDPTFIWESVGDQQMYIRPENNPGTLFQVNSLNGQYVDLKLDHTLQFGSFDGLQNIVLSGYSQVIGDPHTRASNSLLEYLLGQNYPAYYDYHPLTVTLIDIIRPVTGNPDEFGLLLYIVDEEQDYGTVRFVRPEALHMVLHPDRQRIMFQRDDRRIDVYNLDTGVLENSFQAFSEEPRVLAFTALGDVVINDFQRFDTRTGAVLKEDLRYTTYFDRFYFTEDGQKLITLRRNDWWVWDIATGTVDQRTTLDIHGNLLANSPDGMRYLSLVENGVEIYSVASGERRNLTFEELPGRAISDVLPSPDWEHYLVTYSADEYGAAIVMYDFDDGKMWDLMADDLPGDYIGGYGWVNNDTIFLTGEFGSSLRRVLGVEYAASGVPSCLIENFPGDETHWFDVWERFVARLRSDDLNTLAQKVCAELPGTAEDVEAVLFPTATPTEPHITATPALIAGVPSCLTLRFPSQALDYAEDWRNVIQGLTDEQVAEMENLLCESLVGQDSVPQGEEYFYTQNVMTVDVRTGRREIGSFIPVREVEEQPIQPVIDAFYRVENRSLNNPTLSRDGQLIAEINGSGQIVIYRMNLSYQSLLANLTATAVQQVVGENYIGVRPTSTQPFEMMGTARPTLTPTMTLTPPPSPEATVELSANGEVVELCPVDTLYTIANPPPGYAASGRLILPPQFDYEFGEYLPVTPTAIPPTPTIAPTLEDGRPYPTPRATSTPGIGDFNTRSPERSVYMWALEMSDGELYADSSIPPCGESIDCQFSFDRQWILVRDERGIVLSRADGSEAQVLYDGTDSIMWPDDFRWSGQHLLSFSVRDYTKNSWSNFHYINPEGGPTPEPFVEQLLSVNDLPTDIQARQPLNGTIAVATVRVVNETKYYMVDLETQRAEFFARLSNDSISFEWHPFGEVLYYRYSSSPIWYIFDPQTWEHRVLGQLPAGELSPNGKYRLTWYLPDFEEIERREQAGEAVPKISLWDSETGQTRRYCVPRTGSQGLNGAWWWSPDSRSIAFYASLTDEAHLETARPHLLTLDLETGYVTDFGMDLGNPVVWVEGEKR